MYQKLRDVLQGNERNFMLPFYWQHGDHYETIPQEIDRIFRSGCRAFCVESRPHKDFVGETWWRDMDLILSEARKRDMKVWILDDDHFPTGHAAGHIEKYYPEKRRWDIGERHVDVLGPVNKSLLIARQDEENQLLGAYAYKRTGAGEAVDGLSVIDLCTKIGDKFLELTLPEGLWRVSLLYRTRSGKHNPNYIDLLSGESVKVLIDAVYEPHYAHYKEYFGNTIAGFFSDEPQLSNSWFSEHASDPGIYENRLGLFGMAYPWHPDVFPIMEKSLGFDPKPYMPAIWHDIGEMTPQIRYAYMDAVTRLYRRNFTRQLARWCDDHGVEYIGHVIEDMGTHARTGCGTGHYFRALEDQHMSGIDIVLHQLMPGMSDYIHTCSTHGNNADPGFFDYILCKLAPSLARISKHMKGRAMCEVFGAYGWAETGGDMKWLLDHLLVRGVNHFVPHAFSPQFPDPDCPPHFGADDKDPQYEAFSHLMNYGNKIATLLYGGSPVCDAALLYTAESEWMSPADRVDRMHQPARILYDNNIDFDILPMDVLSQDPESTLYTAEVSQKVLTVGPNHYKVLVIPPVEHVPQWVLDRLTQLQNQGANILWLGKDLSPEELLPRLRSLIEPDISVSGTREFLRSCHYSDRENDVYMFVNESLSVQADCHVHLKGIGTRSGLMLDLLNDEVCIIKAKDGKIALSLTPNQSCLVIFGDTDCDCFPQKRNWTRKAEAAFTFRIDIASHENMVEFQPYAAEAQSGNLPCVTSLDRQPSFSGKIRYTASFTGDNLAHQTQLGLDLGKVGDSARIILNGEDLGMRITTPYRFDLTGKVREGENTIVIETANTLANAVQDYFSGYMAIHPAGLSEKIHWLF